MAGTGANVSRIAGRPGPVSGSYDVQARGLDELLDDLGLDAVDVVKIDIEGAESLALAGMVEGMRCGRYHRILLESASARARRTWHQRCGDRRGIA